MAKTRKLLRGVIAQIDLPQGCALVTGTARAELGELAGWSHRPTGISFWPDRAPTDNLGIVDWVVRGPRGATLRIEARHERAGRVERSVSLAADPV